MTEKPKSFDEYYYRTVDDTEDLEILVNYVKNNSEMLGKYEGEIFCPECKIAELYFVHKTSKSRAHLRRCPTSKHEDGCSYNYQYAPKKWVKEIINSMTYNEVQDKLESIMNMLCKGTGKKTNIVATKPKMHKKNNPMLVSSPNTKDNILKALRRKKLNAWVDVEDRNEIFVFYGQVRLEVEEHTVQKEGKAPFTYYSLNVYNQSKEGRLIFRTSLYRGNIKDEVSINDLYYIAIIGQIGEKGWMINMVNKNAVKYSKCK